MASPLSPSAPSRQISTAFLLNLIGGEGTPMAIASLRDAMGSIIPCHSYVPHHYILIKLSLRICSVTGFDSQSSVFVLFSSSDPFPQFIYLFHFYTDLRTKYTPVLSTYFYLHILLLLLQAVTATPFFFFLSVF
jgi:hypothetical protein